MEIYSVLFGLLVGLIICLMCFAAFIVWFAVRQTRSIESIEMARDVKSLAGDALNSLKNLNSDLEDFGNVDSENADFRLANLRMLVENCAVAFYDFQEELEEILERYE